MKKIVLAIAGVGVLAAAGWSALWFTGRGQIEARLDTEIQAFAARGVEIGHASRQIDGFPFAYKVRHEGVTIRDTTQGYAYTLPHLTTEVTADDIDRLVTTLPETFTIELSLPSESDSGEDGTGQTLRVEVEAENMVIVSDGQTGDAQEIKVTAERLLAVSADEDQGASFAVDFTGSDYRATIPSAVSGAPMTAALLLNQIDYAYTVKTQSGINSAGLGEVTANVEGSIADTRITLKSNLRDQAAMLSMFTDNGALLEAAYQTGRVVYAARTVKDQPSGVFSGESGSSAGTMTIKDGRFEIAGSGRANQISYGPAISEGATNQAPSVDVRNIEGIYQLPLTPSDDLAPASLRFALDEVKPDDALWALLDPKSALEREPMKLVVDVEGSARLLKPLTEARPGEAPPLEVGSVSINALDLNLLGLTVRTRGDLDFVQPIWIPEGEITLTTTGLMNTVDHLIDAGLLFPQAKQSAEIMAAIYARAGEAPGELVMDVKMGVEGIFVNGQPVAAGQ